MRWRKSRWFALGLVAWMGLPNAAAQTSTSNLIVDGSVRYQTIDGAGPNINADVWYGGAGAAAIDLWTGTGSASLFRIVYEPTDWVSSQGLIARLHNLDATTLDQVYNQNPRLADLWGVIAYLNAKGVHGTRSC